MYYIIRNKNLQGKSWHGYQLAEQIDKIHVGVIWLRDGQPLQKLGMTWESKNECDCGGMTGPVFNGLDG